MRRNRPRGLHGLALLAAALILAGCGGSDDSEQPRRVGEAGGLEVYEVASAGFSIGVPEGWRVISVDEALPDDEREELARDNPAFAPILGALAEDDQPVKLFAFDPEVSDGFATNVNIVALDLPDGVGLREFVAANEQDIGQFAAVSSEIASEEVTLPSGPAQRLDYRLRLTTAGSEQHVATRQYLLVGENIGFVVTFSTLPQQSASYAPVFDRIVGSLDLG